MKRFFKHRRRRWIAGAAGLVAWGLAVAQAGGALPVFPAGDTTDTFFGTTVRDPYRALEAKTAPEVVAWMKAQDAHTRETLARIPGRTKLLDALLKYDAAVPARVTSVVRETDGLWFYERRGASDDQFKLYRRRGLAGSEQLLVDPEAITRRSGKPHAINYFVPSAGGGRVAYGLSAQGSEEAQLPVIDASSGRTIGAPVTRANIGAPSWAPDGRRLVFNRLQELTPGLPETEKYQRSRVWLWDPAQPIERARPVFGTGTAGVQIEPAEIPFVSLTPDGRWALGLVINGTQREFGLYASPQAALLAGRPQWRRLFGAAAKVVGLAYHRDALYLRSHDRSPRFRLMRVTLTAGSLDAATEIVPPGPRVITDLAAAQDGLYVEMREGNVKRLYRRAWAAGAPLVEVPLPVAGSFSLSADESGAGAADPRLPGLVITLQSWVRAPKVMQVDAKGRVTDTGLQPAGPYDAPADLVATEVTVASHDGARVPMSIIHRRDVKLDGRNPTLLYGYGAYGMTEEPFFSTSRLALLDAGGVFAVANPRGSGVYGEDWYRAGWQATKPNTWKDFIACAEWLVSAGYTTPGRLGILGGSAGGILVGRAMTERPDLFAAVIAAVGALDAVRYETTPNGIPNIPEFGSRATEAGFRALLEMSTYHQIRDGVKYPAVMFTHGVHDPRVEVWESTKTAARLQAASASGRPVLLRLDFDAGHGVGSTKRQQIEERADGYTFLLWQTGAEGFQPK